MKERDFYGYTIKESGEILNQHGRDLKHVEKEGRKEIRLTLLGKRKTFVSARLIYCVFNNLDVSTLDKNQCVTFRDGNKLNIHLDNLKLVHRADLIQGEKHKSRAKLTDEEVEEVKEKYESTKNSRPVNQYDGDNLYYSYRRLAEEYGVTYSMIRHIIKGNVRNEKDYKLNNKKRRDYNEN